MKKINYLLLIAGFFMVSNISIFAQENEENEKQKTEEGTVKDDSVMEMTDDVVGTEEVDVPKEIITDEVEKEAKGFHQTIKNKFISGGPVFMSFVVICLIFGLAIVIERILYLSLSTTNKKKLLTEVEEELNSKGVEAAKEVCRNTSGPIASILYQGLDRMHEGLDKVEKAVIAYGSVQVGNLEKNLSWISLFIALAPMLGFFGTVYGMIDAFDAIAEANNISPGIVAGGIGIALITTLAGLLVAMILQVFYNYIVSKIDSLTNEMEDSSISLIDILIKHELKKNNK